MAWKDWPYWLKGGLIILLIYIIINLLGLVVLFGIGSLGGLAFIGLANLPGGMIYHLITSDSFLGNLPLSVILSIIIYLLFGALIGLIIQKIKSKN